MNFDTEFFRTHGAAGGRLGGNKASGNMTAEQRTARAKKAVAARRWHPPVTEAEKEKRLKAKRPVGRPRKAA
jgi:hypothetical protein